MINADDVDPIAPIDYHDDSAVYSAEQTEFLLAGSYTADRLDVEEIPDLQWTVDDLIPEGSILLVAAPKSGKSFLIAEVALAVAQGGVVLGAIPVKQRRVLYLALEDGKRRLKSRLQMLNRNQPLPERLTLIERVDPLHAVAVIRGWLQWHKHFHADEPAPLVAVDTLGKVRPGRPPGEDPYSYDYRYGTRLKDAIDEYAGASLVALHHNRKAQSDDFIEDVSGTQGIAGAADTILILRRERNSPHAVLHVTGRDVAESEYALIADSSEAGIRWRVDGADLDMAAREASARRIEAARTKTEKGLGEWVKSAIRYVNTHAETTAGDLAQGLNITPKDAADRLTRAYEYGHIERVRRGVYAKLGTPLSTESGAESAESAENPGQSTDSVSAPPEVSAEIAESGDGNSAVSADAETSAENENSPPPGNSALSAVSAHIPGGVTASTAGMTPRVIEILARRETAGTRTANSKGSPA